MAECWLGFNLTRMWQGKVVEQHILGLLNTDEVVLSADNQKDVQLLVHICDQEAANLGLNFSTVKLGIVVFNNSSTDAKSIQLGEISRMEEDKYLGLWINEKNYSTRNNLI